MRNYRFISAVAALCCGVSVAGSPASAGVERIVIDGREEAPASAAAAYRTLRGRAFGTLDPAAPHNRIIQDIELAPRNERGLVEYVAEFTLSYPLERTPGGNVMIFEAVNRGLPIADLSLGLPAADGWESFFASRGFIVLRSAWQGDAPRESVRIRGLELDRLGVDVPVAKSPEGTPIEGPVRAELIAGRPGLHTLPLGGAFAAEHKTYPPVALDDPSAVLTWRRRQEDARTAIPRAGWRFADCSAVPFPGAPDPTRVCLEEGFDPDLIYELIYTARDPLVLGIGFAATRDIAAFFRFAKQDAAGTPNPVSNRIERSLGVGISQAGNFLKTFVHLGFNRDGEGRRVFDGLMPIVASRTNALNIRFGQPGRGAGQHEDHSYPGHNAPSTWAASRDSVAGRRAGILDRCRATRTCPRVVQVLTASEYWQLQASPTHVDPRGRRDIPLPPEVRLYFIASTQHTPAQEPQTAMCTYQNNPAPTRESLRALLVALVDWVRDDEPPPPSVYPRLQARELVPPEEVAWPAIPGVEYRALANPMPLLDFGPQFRAVDEMGIIAREPPVPTGMIYTILVPQVDADGNDLGGIRSVTMGVPLGTHTGWNYRKAGFAEGRLCSLNGSFFPFARTRTERLAAGDPRPSLEERYGDHAGYIKAVREAAAGLVAARLLLPEDAQRLVGEAEDSNALK